MPDFDKIHDGPGPYQKPCRQLVGGMPVEVVADSLLRPIISTLEHYGDDSVDALLEVADHLSQLSAGPLFDTAVEWPAESKVIDRIIQQSHADSKRGLSTVQRVAKRQLQQIQSGVYALGEMRRVLIISYIAEIVKDCFEDPVKRMLYRAEGAYPREHLGSLEQIRLHLLPGIDNLAEQIMSSRSVASMRKPPRRRSARVSRTQRVSASGPAKVAEMPSVYTEDLDAITY